MDMGEKAVFDKKLQEWLKHKAPILKAKALEPNASFMNAIQSSAMWDSQECAAFDEGVSLLTAFTWQAETWLPDKLYVVSLYRVIKRMLSILSGAWSLGPGGSTGNDASPVTAQSERGRSVSNPEPANDKAASKTALPATEKGGGGVPARPEHISQYLHLMPAELQARAGNVKELLRQLDTARENCRLLTNDPHAQSTDLARWAKMANECDKAVKTIYRDLDAEWKKLVESGKVTVDDLGYAHIIGENENQAEPSAEPEKEGGGEAAPSDGTAKKRGRKPMTDEEKEAAAAKKAEDTRAENLRKAGLVRKWLIDTRNAKSDEQTKKWKRKFKEMVKLGGEAAITDKVREAAKYYGIEI